MSRAPYELALTLASVCALGVPAHGQAVISTRSGVINFFEGAVTVNGQPLESRLGRFATIPEGAELRTAQGRAEVLLTPGVFLRVGDNSAIRLVSNRLADTRVELVSGSALVESGAPSAGTSVKVLYKNWSITEGEKGEYRVDSEPARVVVRDGHAKVSAEGGGPVNIDPGQQLPLAAVLVPESVKGENGDNLNQWAQGRAESVAADNAIAEGIQDPAKVGMGTTDAAGLGSVPVDGFTYFPMLGLSSADPNLARNPYSSAVYGTMGPQPGFSALYLPGYTYRPMLIGLPRPGISGLRPGYPRTYLPALPTRVGGSYPVSSGPRPIGTRPVTGAHPAVPPRPAPHVGVHR